MAEEEDRNVRPLGPTGPSRPTGPTRPQGARAPDINGLVRTDRGWYDPASRTYLSPSHSRVQAAEAAVEAQQQRQEQQDFLREQMYAPMLRDGARAATEADQRAQEQAELMRQAEAFQLRRPEILQREAEIQQRIFNSLPEDVRENPELLQQHMGVRLRMDPEYRAIEPFLNAYNEFITNYPDLIDPSTQTRYQAEGGQASTAGFADSIGAGGALPSGGDAPLNTQNFQPRPRSLQEARQQLADLQARLPEGTAEERRRFAEETFVQEGDSERSYADLILSLDQEVRDLQAQQQQQPQGFTPEQIGITPEYRTPERAGLDGRTVGGNMVEPLGPRQRGFVRLPDGSYRSEGTIGGVPSLAVLQGLERNAAPTRTGTMSGELVGEDQYFTHLPQGFVRNAVGTPNSDEVLVNDTRIDPNAPRFGVFQNADGSWTGLGERTGEGYAQQGGFATEEEAINWSRLHFPQPGGTTPPPAAPINVAETPSQPTVPPTFEQSFSEGGLFGQGGIFNPTEEQRQASVEDRRQRVDNLRHQMAGMGDSPPPQIPQFRNPSSFYEWANPSVAGFFGGPDARRQSEEFRRDQDAFYADQRRRNMGIPAEAFASLEEHRRQTGGGTQETPLRPELMGGGIAVASPSETTPNTTPRTRSPFGLESDRRNRRNQFGAITPGAF